MKFFHYIDTKCLIPIVLFVIAIALAALAGVQVGKWFKDKNRNPGVYIIAAGFVLIVAAVMMSADYVRHINIELYDEAIAYEAQEDWANAYSTFRSLGRDYKDADEHMDYIYPRYQYDLGNQSMKVKLWYQAFEYFNNCRDYEDSDQLADYCYYKYLQERHPEWDDITD